MQSHLHPIYFFSTLLAFSTFVCDCRELMQASFPLFLLFLLSSKVVRYLHVIFFDRVVSVKWGKEKYDKVEVDTDQVKQNNEYTIDSGEIISL
jgi:hypothetical protein